MDDFIASVIAVLVLAGIIIGLIFAMDKMGVSRDKECKNFYGQQFSYVSGDRSPDLCATQDGKVRYYNLINR